MEDVLFSGGLSRKVCHCQPRNICEACLLPILSCNHLWLGCHCMVCCCSMLNIHSCHLSSAESEEHCLVALHGVPLGDLLYGHLYDHYSHLLVQYSQLGERQKGLS